MKGIVFTGQLKPIRFEARNDGDICKIGVIIRAYDNAVAKLIKVFGKIVEVKFSLGPRADETGDQLELGTATAEFKGMSPTAKTTGDIVRLAFTVKAHDPVVINVVSQFGETVNVEVLESRQAELFPEPDVDQAEIEDDEPDINVEEIKV